VNTLAEALEQIRDGKVSATRRRSLAGSSCRAVDKQSRGVLSVRHGTLLVGGGTWQSGLRIAALKAHADRPR
jgi:hypothetical protein